MPNSDSLRRRPSRDGHASGIVSNDVFPILDPEGDYLDALYQGSRIGMERLCAKGYPQNW